MNKLALAFVMSILFSCSAPVEKKPSDILSESQMIEALVDVHLLESASKLNLLEGAKGDSSHMNDYYHLLFESKAYSLQQFKKSFSYYSEDPILMEILLDSTLTRIQMLEVN